MRVKPVFKTEHQAIKEEINKRMDDVKVGMKEMVKQVIDDKNSGIKEIVKQVIEDKDSGIDKNIEDVIEKKLNDGASVPGSKLSRMIDVIKEKKETVGHEEDIINCPACHVGHMHALTKDMGKGGKKHNGVSYKCTGHGCGNEFVMVDKKADYKCSNCNAPIRKPVDESKATEYDGCPFCNGTKATRWNWQKLWDVKK